MPATQHRPHQMRPQEVIEEEPGPGPHAAGPEEGTTMRDGGGGGRGKKEEGRKTTRVRTFEHRFVRVWPVT